MHTTEKTGGETGGKGKMEIKNVPASSRPKICNIMKVAGYCHVRDGLQLEEIGGERGDKETMGIKNVLVMLALALGSSQSFQNLYVSLWAVFVCAGSVKQQWIWIWSLLI
jgi:hypothetical protein